MNEAARIWNEFTSGNKMEKQKEQAEQAVVDAKEQEKKDKIEEKQKLKALKKHKKERAKQLKARKLKQQLEQQSPKLIDPKYVLERDSEDSEQETESPIKFPSIKSQSSKVQDIVPINKQSRFVDVYKHIKDKIENRNAQLRIEQIQIE